MLKIDINNKGIFTLIILLKLILFSAFNSILAQDVQLKASVSKNKVGINETFEYSIEVSGKSTSLPTPVLPSFTDFTNLSSTPSTSTSIQFINGKISSTLSYTVFLQPQKTGEFIIAPATLEVEGEVIKSNEIKITVTKQSTKPKAQSQTPQSRQDADISGEDLYLKAEVDKKSAYQNDQIIVTYKLYFRINVRSYDLEKIPANPGFWTEEFKIPSQPTIETEVINGIAYNVATLKKVALFPTQSGDLTVEPMVIAVDAVIRQQRRSRSLFDSFFDDPFGRTVRKSLATKPVTIKVKPIPDQDKPVDFSGAVGKYTLTIQTDKKVLKVNDAATVKLTLVGEGNIKLLKLPDLSLPPDIEVYDPTEKTIINREHDKISGSKIVEYVIFPRYEGEYTLKPITFSYFDPKSGRFKQLNTTPITFQVLPGAAIAGGVISGSSLSKQEVALLGEDIRFIKEKATFYLTDEKIYHNWLYYFSYLVPILGFVFIWNYAKQREKIRSDVHLARKRRAGKIASKHLNDAKKAMKTTQKTDFYRKMSQALQGFVSDRLNIQITDFNVSTVTSNLAKVGVKPDEIQEYQVCLDESDFRQFAGGDVDLEEMKSFFERAKKILTRLEKYI